MDAIRLFIAEEQRHGEMLGRFLDAAGVPRAQRNLGDSLFRVFRHFLMRMEVWATVVVIIEVHAMPYYAAIRRATGSEVLRRICEQILRDEVPHVRFQCERLAIIHRRRWRVFRWLTAGAQRVLFVGLRWRSGRTTGGRRARAASRSVASGGTLGHGWAAPGG